MSKKSPERPVPVVLAALEKCTAFLGQIATAVSAAGLVLMIVCILISVCFRYVFRASWTWGEEACRYIMVYSMFMGIFLAAREGTHVSVEAVLSFTNGSVRRLFVLLAKVICLVGYAWLAVLSYQYTQKLFLSGQTSPALHLPMWAVVSIIFISFVCCVLESCTQLWRFFLDAGTDETDGGSEQDR